MMSVTEFVVRLISKLLLIVSIIVLIIGGFSVEGDMGFAVRIVIIGICMAVPDIVIWVLDGFNLRDKEGNKNDRDHGRIEG